MTLLALLPSWLNDTAAWAFGLAGVAALIYALIPAAPQRSLAQVGGALALAYACYLGGFSTAQTACEADKLRADLAAKERDLSAARTAQADAGRRADILDETLKANAETIDEYERELATRKDGGCALGDDDIRRLHNLKP